MPDTFHTLSLFPDLFTYQLAAVSLLRIFLGASFIVYGYQKLASKRERYRRLFTAFHKESASLLHPFIGIVELVAGIMILVGVYMQAAVLALAFLTFIAADLKSRRPKALPRDLAVYLSLFIISLSLLFLGPGVFAIDLPL